MVSEALVKSKTCFQATSFENVVDTGNHHQVAER